MERPSYCCAPAVFSLSIPYGERSSSQQKLATSPFEGQPASQPASARARTHSKSLAICYCFAYRRAPARDAIRSGPRGDSNHGRSGYEPNALTTRLESQPKCIKIAPLRGGVVEGGREKAIKKPPPSLYLRAAPPPPPQLEKIGAPIILLRASSLFPKHSLWGAQQLAAKAGNFTS